ncbi:MAG: hypothetical protein ACK4XJ_01620 [Fimbriimonadaceae bacterium]
MIAGAALIKTVIKEVEAALDRLPPVQAQASGTIEVDYIEPPKKQWESIIPVRMPEIRRATTFTAERFSLRVDAQEFSSQGTIRIDDPSLLFQASALNFNWRESHGSASNVEAQTHSYVLTVREARTDHYLLEVDDVKLTAYVGNYPLYGVSARKVLSHGQGSTVVDGASAYLLGKKIITLPRMRLENVNYTLLRDLPDFGIRDGSPSYQHGLRFRIGEGQFLEGAVAWARGSYPYYAAQYAVALAEPKTYDGYVMAVSDIQTGYLGSWFENVTVRNPHDTRGMLTKERLAAFVGSYWNADVTNYERDFSVSMPIYTGVFTTGTYLGFPVGLTVGGARVQEISEGRADQLAAYGSALLVDYNVSRGIDVQVRGDAAYFLTNGRPYSWVRGSGGVVLTILPQLRVGAAYVDSVDYGRPKFRFDQLFASREYHTRVDLNLGPTQVRYLNRYDLATRQWFQAQVYVSQVMGAVRPFVVWNQQSGGYSFGFDLRLDDVFGDLLKRRITDVKVHKDGG